MKNPKYKPRIIDKTIETYLNTFGAVCVEGPKWCGKTWTSAYHSESAFYVGDPEGNFYNRRLAEISPSVILNGSYPRLIDEWQEVPPIWDAVRSHIDRTSQKGLFILTGSATPNHKGILHSGAGRIAKLRMRTMSLYESGDSQGLVSLKDLCNGDISDIKTGEPDLMKLIELIIRGGWPGSIGLSADKAYLLPAAYLNAIIDDDVYRTDGIRRNTDKMRLLLRSLARNESTPATNRTLKNDIKETDDEDINVETVAEYLDILGRLFITDNQPPFSANVRSSARVSQAVKRRFADPSLACATLGLKPEGLLKDLETLGFMFESLCVRDLKIYAKSFGAAVYHYRDYAGQEIDAVIETEDGDWCAFEIKLGIGQVDKAAQSLISVQKKFATDPKAKPPAVLCVISGMADAAYKREDGVFVVPLTALKD